MRLWDLADIARIFKFLQTFTEVDKTFIPFKLILPANALFQLRLWPAAIQLVPHLDNGSK